jgi:hypothetical protein
MAKDNAGDRARKQTNAAKKGVDKSQNTNCQAEECCNDQPKPLDAETLCNKAGTAGCDYYQKRHDDYVSRHSCCDEKSSPPDYYLEYGLKYCVRFTKETNPNLSPKGQAWLQKARCNLQRMMEDDLQRHPELEQNADKFREFAFDTHPQAYLDAGLADLSLSDWWQIAKTPDIEEWGSLETWKQAFETGGGIANKTAGDAWDWTKDTSSEARDWIKNFFDGSN